MAHLVASRWAAWPACAIVGPPLLKRPLVNKLPLLAAALLAPLQTNAGAARLSDPRRVGLRHRGVVHATQQVEGRPGFGAIARTDVETGRSQRFVYGPQAMVEEHVFVPDGRRPGWILGTVLDLALGKTVLSCFAADQLGAGPVPQAILRRALPLGLHGAFVPA
jgi:hypothetical protein